MVTLRRVSPEQAIKLLHDGRTLIDVRSEQEFALGHIPGAFNVPLMQPDFDTLADNPDFLSVVCACFEKQQSLLLNCASGSRSRRAALLLLGEGFTDVADLNTGIDGCRDEFGQLEAGWLSKGFPLERHVSVAQNYAHLRERANLNCRSSAIVRR